MVSWKKNVNTIFAIIICNLCTNIECMQYNKSYNIEDNDNYSHSSYNARYQHDQRLTQSLNNIASQLMGYKSCVRNQHTDTYNYNAVSQSNIVSQKPKEDSKLTDQIASQQISNENKKTIDYVGYRNNLKKESKKQLNTNIQKLKDKLYEAMGINNICDKQIQFVSYTRTMLDDQGNIVLYKNTEVVTDNQINQIFTNIQNTLKKINKSEPCLFILDEMFFGKVSPIDIKLKNKITKTFLKLAKQNKNVIFIVNYLFKDSNFDKKETKKMNIKNPLLDLIKLKDNTVHELISTDNKEIIINAISKLNDKLRAQELQQLQTDLDHTITLYNQSCTEGQKHFIDLLDKYVKHGNKIEYILRNHTEVYSRGNTVFIHNKQSYCNEFNEDLIKNIILYNKPQYKCGIQQNKIHNFFEKYVMLDICYDYYNGYHKENKNFAYKLLYILQSNTISKIYNENLPTNILIAHIDKAENINNECGKDMGNGRKTGFLWYNTFNNFRVSDASHVIFNYKDCSDVTCSKCKYGDCVVTAIYTCL